MQPTQINFADERPARWLVRYNLRLFNWLVFPALLILIAIVQLRCIAANQSAIAAAMVLWCAPLAALHRRIRLTIIRFWIEFHQHVLKHGRTGLSNDVLPQWYRNARLWLTRNRLTGGIDSYWRWSFRDCRQFSRLYKVLHRREHEVETPPLAETNSDAEQINSMLREMRNLVEELGPIGELILCNRYRFVLFVHTALCFAMVLLAPIALFDPECFGSKSRINLTHRSGSSVVNRLLQTANRTSRQTIAR